MENSEYLYNSSIKKSIRIIEILGELIILTFVLRN